MNFEDLKKIKFVCFKISEFKKQFKLILYFI